MRVEAHRLRKNLKEYYERGRRQQPGPDCPRTRALRAEICHPDTNFRGGASADTAQPQSQGETPVGVVQLRGGTSGPNVSRRARRTAAWVLAGLAVVLTLLLLRWKSHSVQSRDQPLMANAAGPAGAPASTEPDDAVRILAGYTRGDYIDRQGKRWTSDRYYSGGEISSQAHQSLPVRPITRCSNSGGMATSPTIFH